MKRTLSTAILLFFVSQLQAKIYLGIEGGYNETGARSGVRSHLSRHWGAMAGFQYKLLTADIGMRSWNSEYYGHLRGTDGKRRATSPYDAVVNNISIPIGVGVRIPIPVAAINIKAIYAPTILRNSAVLPYANVAGASIDGFYHAGGVDVGAGYPIGKHITIDLKYSFLSYLNKLNYQSEPDAVPYYSVLNDRVYMHGVSLQFNYYL